MACCGHLQSSELFTFSQMCSCCVCWIAINVDIIVNTHASRTLCLIAATGSINVDITIVVSVPASMTSKISYIHYHKNILQNNGEI